MAVPKLADVVTGDTLAPKGIAGGRPATGPPSRSALSIAIRPKSKGDEDKLMIGLHRLQEEDPALVVERVDETHQTILSGHRRDPPGGGRSSAWRGSSASRWSPRRCSSPTARPITRPTEAEGKYKKQTGGHGQFGVASIRIEPLERGEGFRFVDQVVGGAIPRQYIPAVEKGIIEAMAHGGVHGYPVVDVQATCLDGKHHPVDSSEMSFKMAGSLAFKEAMAKAGPVLLEPDLAPRGDRAGHHAGQRPRRPQLPPGAGAGHRHPGRRGPEDHRPGAPRPRSSAMRSTSAPSPGAGAGSGPSTTTTT